MKKMLTAVTIERLNPPATGRFGVSDVSVPGLCLRVTDRGVKTWSVLYRVLREGGVNGRGHVLKGKQRRLTIGSWPAVDLSTARERARKVLCLASEGKDPAELRREEAIHNISNTVSKVVERFIELHAKPHTKNWHGTKRIFEMYVIPKWGNLPIRNIRRTDAHDLLDGLIADNRASVASEVRKHLSRLFNWAADREIIPASPLAGMARRDLRQSKEAGRALAAWELKIIWQAASRMEYPFGPMYQILILTGQRLREIAHASRGEINEAHISERPIQIKHQSTGVGAVGGAAAGGVAGSYIGAGRGSILGVIGGAIIGGIAGHIAEQGIMADTGIEFTIKTVNPGNQFQPVISIPQNVSKSDRPIPVGSCVMVQTGGGYQRVLPVDDISQCQTHHHRRHHRDDDDQ